MLQCNMNFILIMYLIPLGWLYVAVLMAAAEAATGTVLGAAITFLLYGVGPVALLIYLMGHPGRRRARLEREAAEREAWRARTAASGDAPDTSREASADTVAPMRKES